MAFLIAFEAWVFLEKDVPLLAQIGTTVFNIVATSCALLCFYLGVSPIFDSEEPAPSGRVAINSNRIVS